MTNRSAGWTRRQFSQALAACSASALLARSSRASLSNEPLSAENTFAFAAFPASGASQGFVRVCRRSASGWREVHTVQAASPTGLVMHPAASMLYVVHDVALWEHRPRGAVSAYRFNTATGRLQHAGTQPLSLSATNPRSAVLVAGGSALFVAAETGGIYNVLPIALDGTLQPVSAIRKEFGTEDNGVPRTAAPRTMTILPDGVVQAIDPGKGTISHFVVGRDAIVLKHRSRSAATSGWNSRLADLPRGLTDNGLRGAGLLRGATSLTLHTV